MEQHGPILSWIKRSWNWHDVGVSRAALIWTNPLRYHKAASQRFWYWLRRTSCVVSRRSAPATHSRACKQPASRTSPAMSAPPNGKWGKHHQRALQALAYTNNSP